MTLELHLRVSVGTGSLAVAIVALTVATAALANDVTIESLRTGKEVYDAGCLACHGPNGEGTPKSTLGFEPPKTFPDFGACDQTAPETMQNWRAIIRDGGPARGFSPIMPAFGDSLSAEQIAAVARHLRGLCQDRSWAPGDLNLPRALFTEKAYPESEVVITTSINAEGPPGGSNDFVYERRLGGSSQLEIEVPYEYIHNANGGYTTGVGDMTVGLKRMLLWHLNPNGARGSILSVQGEAILPTGNKSKGLGTGELALGAFVSYDALLPRDSFLQVQAGGEAPISTGELPNAVYMRAALGKSFAENAGAGRLWSPMLEMLVDRDLESDAVTLWDVVPQFQVTISQRQHVRAALGYRWPLNQTQDRPREVVFYFLWDWFDGGLFEGW